MKTCLILCTCYPPGATGPRGEKGDHGHIGYTGRPGSRGLQGKLVQWVTMGQGGQDKLFPHVIFTRHFTFHSSIVNTIYTDSMGGFLWS